MGSESACRPPVRTFKPRRRALTPARQELVERLAPTWLLDETGPPLDPATIFGRTAPLVLDVGIGLGDSFTTTATLEPHVDSIGVDVHTPGIASSLARIEQIGLRNVRLVHGDALVFLDRIPGAGLAGVRIFFPDPWPKARHRHRRLAHEQHLDRFVRALRPGGWIHVATDIDDYAVEVERTWGNRGDLVGGVIDRPADRPITRYERKGLDAGRSSTDLLYRRSVG